MSRLCFYAPVAVLCAALALGCAKPTTSVTPAESGPAAPTEADKAEAAKRLKQIMLALFNFHDSNMRFPVGIVGPGGKLGLSWRVTLLPLLGEEEAKLYEQFNTKEPWDSEHNKTLIEKMPRVYASPGAAAASGKTHFRSFVGPHAFIHDPKGPGVHPWSKYKAGEFVRGRQVTSFTDGTSNTLAVAESPEPVEWTKPDDIPFLDDLAATASGTKLPPVPKLGGVFPGGFHAVLADGAVQFFPDTLPEKDLRALISADSGDMFGPETLAILRGPQPKLPDAGRPAPPRGPTKRAPTSK